MAAAAAPMATITHKRARPDDNDDDSHDAPSFTPTTPFLRRQSSAAASTSSLSCCTTDGPRSSSLGSCMDSEDIEGLVMSYLTYPEALRVSLACKALNARWPFLRDGLESITLDPSRDPRFTPQHLFAPLLHRTKALASRRRRKVNRRGLVPQPQPQPHPVMRRLRRLVVRGGPVGLLNAELLTGLSARAAATEWRLSRQVLGSLRGLFPRLVELDLAGCRLGLEGATELARGVRQGGGWPCLKRIDLRDNLLNSAGLTRLAEAFCAPAPPSLPSTPTAGRPPSANRRRRRPITMDDDDEEEEEAAAVIPLPCCPPPQLEEINLENNAIFPEAFTGNVHARLPPTLRRLNLRDNHIGDAGLAALSALLGDGITPSTTTSDGGKEEAVEGGQCPLLEELHLGYNDVGPVGLRALSAALRSDRLPHLRHLELSGNNLLGDEGQGFLGDDGGNRDDGGVRAFAGALEAGCCPRLAVLALDDTDMTDGGLSAIARALKRGHCPRLKELNLGGGSNCLIGTGLEALGEALAGPQGPKGLEVLSLDGCEELEEEAITRFLATTLVARTPTTTVCIGNGVGEAGAGGATDDPAALCNNGGEGGGYALSCLRHLSLRGLSVSDDGARAIAAAMEKGALPKLERLHLDFTDVQDEGVCALVAALVQDPCPCPNLASLRLRCSLVRNKGAHALASLLLLPHADMLPAMREVDVSSTNVVNSERLRRVQAKLRRVRPQLTFIYESIN